MMNTKNRPTSKQGFRQGFRQGFPQRRPVRSLIEQMEPRQLLAWSAYAQLIGQDQLATKYPSITGVGQVVAMIDTGIDYNNASLGGGFGAGKKVIGGYDFVDNDADPMDTDGHGTETAGMVAANQFTYNGVTYSGIAPDAKLVAVRVGSGTGGIADSKIESGLQWVIDNYKKFGITIVNISLGGGSYAGNYTGSQLTDEFQKLADLNIFVVAASGNDGTSNVGVAYPAADPNVFAAGSVTSADQLSSFTQRGTELDLLAPGEQVVSTKKGGSYSTVDGTSFSSPIVAGAAALLRQAGPALGAKDVASVLRTSSAADYDGDGDSGITTSRYYARLNLINAISLAESRDDAKLTSLSSSRSTSVDSIVDASGIVHLAYYDAEGHRILYATQRSDGEWTEPQTIDKSGDDVGQQLSIALDQAGRPAIAYFDATKADLRYATYVNGRWSYSTVEAKNFTGQYPSLAFDQSGDAVIAFYKKSGGDLKLATYDRTTSAWDVSVLDSTGDVGQYASLAYYSSGIGGDVSLAIAYADKTNGDVKYYRSNSTGVIDEVVDNLDGVANVHVSLDIRPDDQVAAHVAYQDTKNADVKVAIRVDVNSWASQTVASSGSVGQSIDSYVDSAKHYHVVYYNKTKGATYDAAYTVGVVTSALTVFSTVRVGTAGQIATVATNDDGVTAIVGLNKSGKSLGAWSLVEDV